MITFALAVAGVLTVVRAAPALTRRLAATSARPPHGLPIVALALLLGWTAFGYWNEWRPLTQPPAVQTPSSPPDWPANYTTFAHIEPLPDGRLPAHAPRAPVTRWFPVDPIRQAVRDVLGPNARPRTLSYDERLFAYLPWPGFIAVDRTAAGTLTRWDDRHATLVRLAGLTDPAVFAQTSAHTRFGRIDLFVLRRDGERWRWKDVYFQPGQFDRATFAIVTGLPEGTVLAIRHPPAP
jgi:hypothetical protein